MSPPQRLMGLHEVAEHFAVNRQLVYKWSQRESFPEPVAVLAQGKVWAREDIVAWGRKNGRKAGMGPKPHLGGATR